MIKLLPVLLLVSCGIIKPTPLPEKNKDKIELVIEHKNFAPMRGNSNLFGGLLCASGEKQFCNIVYENITPNGIFCRKKEYVGEDRCLSTDNSFSSDEALGVIMFIITNKDINLANKFQGMIDRYNNKLCLDATDDKCYIFPPLYGIIKKTWEYLGLKPNAGIVAGSFGELEWQEIASIKVVVSYRTHLIMTYLYINQLLNIWNVNLQRIANNLLNRQPNNLFAQYLATGKFNKILFYKLYSERTSIMDQWFLQNNDTEEKWKQSCGWDYQFLVNLYNK